MTLRYELIIQMPRLEITGFYSAPYLLNVTFM